MSSARRFPSIFPCVFFFLLFLPHPQFSAHADCEVVDRANGGLIIFCSGTDTDGVRGGRRDDRITVQMDAEIALKYEMVGLSPQYARAMGIDAGKGYDEITNFGAIRISAEAIAASGIISVDVGGNFEGDALSRARAAAIGVEGGKGDDEIVSTGTITAGATATTAGGSITVGNGGETQADASGRAMAVATGINAGEGNNEIIHAGAMKVSAGATVGSGSIDVGVGGNAGADVSGKAKAVAKGIHTGEGKDEMVNDGSMTVTADAIVGAGEISVGANGNAEGNASGTAKAVAVGISSGGGKDEIANTGSFTVDSTAVAAAGSIAVGVSSGDGNGEPQGSSTAAANASGKADALAVGIDGGWGKYDDEVVNTGDLAVTASATVGAGSISVAVEGDASGNVSGVANARAKGIRTGDGDDEIINAGSMSVGTEAIVGTGAIDVSVKGNVDADASGTAKAATIGIDSGQGDDKVKNTGTMSVAAKATGVAGSISVGILGDGGNGESQESSEESVTSTVKANALSKSVAAAKGIDAGDGNDSIYNKGEIGVLAASNAAGVTASLVISGSAKGDVSGSALSKSGSVAEGYATAIDSGIGDDLIVNEGSKILAKSDSQSTTVAVGIGVEITKEGSAETSTLSEAVSVSKSYARGIISGDGEDKVINKDGTEITAQADSTATGVAVSISVSGSAKGDVSGRALSKSGSVAEGYAKGIDAGRGDDLIVNEAAKILAKSDSQSTTVAVGIGVGITKDGSAETSTLSDATSYSKADTKAITSGTGDDKIINKQGTEVTAQADSTATGVAVSISVSGSAKGDVSGRALSKSGSVAEGYAMGVDAGRGDDLIVNEAAKILAKADSKATTVAVGLGVDITMDGSAETSTLSDASSVAKSYARGITTGDGEDKIINKDGTEITTQADSTATGVAVSLSVSGSAKGDVSGSALSKSGSIAEGESVGITSGQGDDLIINRAKILADSDSIATSVAVSADVAITIRGNASGAALSNASATAKALATGIDGGEGDDIIINEGMITLMHGGEGDSDVEASAQATTVSVTITGTAGGDTRGRALSDSSSTAEAMATGIDGGKGNDKIINRGKILADVDAEGKSVAVAGAVIAAIGSASGASLSDARSTARATAIGIDGGEGADRIFNAGEIELRSNSNAEGVSVSFQLGGTVGTADQSAIAKTSITSESVGIAIDGGKGNDRIINRGNLTVETGSDLNAKAIAVNVSIVGAGFTAQSAVADASGTSRATAAGILGGDGTDVVDNDSTMHIKATSNATTSGYSIGISGISIGAGVNKALSDTSNSAAANALGISGGKGKDDISSWGDMTVEAISKTDNKSRAVTVNALSLGGQLQSAGAKSTTTSNTLAKGIEGGEDADTIVAEGTLKATADSKVLGVSKATTVTGLQIGYNSQESLAQAETSANSVAMGIDGGEGDDWINSKAAITLNSTSDARTESVSVTASGFNIAGATLGASVADASTSVTSTGTGIGGGDGLDSITSTEAISVTAKSTANAKSVSTVTSTTFIGAAKGKAVSNSSARLASFARGIDGGAGGDEIINRGTITVKATSDGTANSSATVKENVVFGEASAKTASAAAAEATADAAGISGGGGDDSIQSHGSIRAKAEAIMNVTVSSVSVANAGWFGDAFAAAISDSSSRTAAIVSGIDGGEGNDGIWNQGAILSSATSTTRVTQTTVAIAKTGPFGGSADTVANSSTAATSETTAKGISAGAGDDKICNTGLVVAEAGGTVGVTTLTVSSDGPANADARTLALAHATGIDGGAGNNQILNRDIVFVKSVPRIESGARIIGDNVDGTAQIGMEVKATGIAGGENRDTITNKGDILVLVGRPESESTVTGGGVGGKKTIIDISRKGQDPQALIGKWMRFQGEEGPDFLTVVEGFDPETGTFTLRDGIPGDREPNSKYTLLDYGTKGPDIASVRVSIGGRVSVDASTTASIAATGIDGGDGDDVVMNSGTIQVMAGNAIKAGERVVGRNIRVDLKAESKVNSLGIAGGGGRNEIMNWGTIGVGADATLDANGWIVDYGGQADIQTEGRTQATSNGIQGGESRDSIDNSGRIATRSTSAVESREERVQVKFYGTSKQILSFKALSDSAGIAAGAGDDVIVNGEKAVVEADSASSAIVQGVTTTRSYFDPFGIYRQETYNFSDARAASTGRGIDLGEGSNFVYNAGEINVSAHGATDARAISNTIYNETNADADATTEARASGIRAEKGSNVVINRGAITAGAKAAAFSLAQGANIGGTEQDLKSKITADGASGTTTFIDESQKGKPADEFVGKWIRFLTGQNLDVVRLVVGFNPETGQFTVSDPLQELKKNDEYTLSDARNGNSGSVAKAFAKGFDLSASDYAGVKNKGRLRVSASAQATSEAQTYIGAAKAGAEATAEVEGVQVGDGDNWVTNEGLIQVTANSSAITLFAGTQSVAHSSALGIRTGDGNNHIYNRGLIDVTAIASAQKNGFIDSASATAIGIKAGEGNDRIFNYGTLHTRQIVNGIESLGTAIEAGGGDDHVSLLKGSATRGHVDLGSGDDSLEIFENASVTGNATGGPGHDSLLLYGAGQFGGQLNGFETAIKSGRGTYTLGFLQPVKRLQVNEGTLAINHSYQLASDGTFQAQVNRDGSHGQLKINGVGGLDGELKVIRGRGPYRNGTRYSILVADQVNGWFTKETLPEPVPLLKFQVTGYPDHVEVEALAKSCTTVAKNKVQMQIAQYLDRIMPAATGRAADVLGEFQALSEPEFQRAFSSLSPDSYGRFRKTTFGVAREHLHSLHKRMHSVRLYDSPIDRDLQRGSLSYIPSLVYGNASTEMNLDQIYHLGQLSKEQPKNGPWMSSFGQKEGQAQTNGYGRFNYSGNGTTFGSDQAHGKNLISGVSFAQSRGSMSFHDYQGEGNVESSFSSLYGSYFTKNGYLEAVGSYARNRYQNERHLAIGPILQNASSSHEGDVLSAYASAGRYFSIQEWVLEPFASVQYTRYAEEGFQESGAGGLSLRIADQRINSLVGELGLRLWGVWETRIGSFIPELNASWNYDCRIDDRAIRASLVDFPDAQFSIQEEDTERQGARFGAALSFSGLKGLKTTLSYNGEIRGSSGAHSIFGFVRYEF